MIEIKQQAVEDLRNIGDYIARDNPDRAESFVAELLERIAWVGANPRLYPIRVQWRTGLRIANHGNYRILYRTGDDLVVFLRIVHSSRDLESIVDAFE
ncbi:type II toxin-antitoxin system RelE/ParE family toxin [Altererythrobacter sp.]|uniref:type II toxin-antitoxin system RelE/ParE family toxin n=1 Tax=Altererythrobacter sp. TaxID=1872480 RepID=UPI003D08C553